MFIPYALMIAALAAPPPAIGTEVGNIHPDFILPTIDGSFIRLSDYFGKKVLLVNFASW